MGTYLSEKGYNNSKCEIFNITSGDIITKIHDEYIKSGAKAIKTNTFAANRINFADDLSALEQVIKQGFSLAEKVAEGRAYVFADIGPIPQIQEENLVAEYKYLADIFIEAGAKNFLFETLNNGENLEEIASYIKGKVEDAFIIASFAISPDGYSRDGISGANLLKTTYKNIDCVGINCVSGPHHMLEFIRENNLGKLGLSVMPNAGYPTVINNRTFFDASPEYFADTMARIVKQGARIIGGCCGTTPDYIKAVSQVVGEALTSTVGDSPLTTEQPKTQNQNHRTNSLLTKLSNGKKVIAVELDPPADCNIEKFMNNAKLLKEVGVDIITVADCPVGRARMDAGFLSCKIKRELGVDTLPHLTCRDRNLNATKAMLMAMNIEGIDNVLVVTGDPVPTAERDEVKSVFNFNSRMLANYIATLNENVLPSPYGICGALNINAKNFSVQLRLAKEKIAKGVEVFLTQPALTPQGRENLKLAYEQLDAKILAGIIPIVSYRNACFMDSEISGIDVDEETKELYKDKTPEQCRQLAVDISVNIAKEVSAYSHGLYLITPFSKADLVAEIIEKLK